MHQFNPLSMVANEGDSRERDDRPHYYGDDHLWIVVSRRLVPEGDRRLRLPQEAIPTTTRTARGTRSRAGTVLEHLKRSLDFTKKRQGQAHGLPLLGFADWNDTVNLPTGAESSFNANLLRPRAARS